jgi:diadenosine tetraphosphate (Ap4A) HIT family hydrolase
MPLTLFSCRGGRVTLPDRAALLLDRAEGGNLCLFPPRDVWERGELSPEELTAFGFLVAAAGHAMLEALPQLHGGCINYWEAGNWALNDAAEPRGRKTAREHRHMHLHLLGRSPSGSRWGESPRFPDYADRLTWAAEFQRLTPLECGGIVTQTQARLETYYRVPAGGMAPWAACSRCEYPAPVADQVDRRCPECRARP